LNVLILFSAVTLLYIVWIRPHSHSQSLPKRLAHRGLFRSAEGILENTLEAFQNARSAKLGVELDVQLSADGVVYVFHDATLQRLAGRADVLQELRSAELDTVRLSSTQKLCRFSEVLALELPFIMIEIKPTGRAQATVAAVLADLVEYEQPICLCSFDPRIVHEVKRQAPQLMRGLIQEASLAKTQYSWIERIVLEFALLNGVIQPHFMSFDVKHKGLVRWIYQRLRWPVALWTVRPGVEVGLWATPPTEIFETEPIQ
jgi:glycerophosphoryl diester phosphodiesterase